MAHHGSSPFDGMNQEGLNKFFEENSNKKMPENIQHPLGLGATGKFPDGKLNDNDEGEIMVGITSKDGRVILDFGKPIHWIGLTKEQAKGIAESLLKHSK